MIKIKIDLAKMTGVKVVKGTKQRPDGKFGTFLDITEARIFVGREKDGHTPYYLDLVAFDKKPSQFGDWRDDQTHFIAEDKTKEERDAKVETAILGNASDSTKRRTNDRPPAAPTVDHGNASDTKDDDVPF
jgi:hypothetical protein